MGRFPSDTSRGKPGRKRQRRGIRYNGRGQRQASLHAFFRKTHRRILRNCESHRRKHPGRNLLRPQIASALRPLPREQQTDEHEKAISGEKRWWPGLDLASAIKEEVPHFSCTLREVGSMRPTSPLLLPCPLLTLRHYPPQDPVDPSLVTRAFGLEPVHHLDIHAQRNPSLTWTVPARLRARLLIRQRQQVVLNRCMQLDHSPRPRPRLPPPCFLGFGCHDIIVYPLPS